MSQRQWAILLLAIGLGIRLFYVFATPLYPAQTILPGYNDEPLHLQYIHYMVEWRSIPIWYPEESATNPMVDEYGQSPLYYVMAIPAYKAGEFLGEGWGLYGARLTSLFFGIVAAMFVYWSAVRLTNDKRVALGAFSLALLSPNAVIFSSLVTNDSALACVSTMAFHSLLIANAGEGGTVRQVKTGIYLGLAVWAKMSAIALLPLALFAASNRSMSSGLSLTTPEQCKEDGPSRVDLWIARWRTLITATAVAAPLIVWYAAHYGLGMPMVERYSPEVAMHVSGGGMFHPVMAIKAVLRTAVMPFEQSWGSPLEKMLTVGCVLIATFLTIIGLREIWRSSYRILVLTSIALLAGALAVHNIRMFQVEFRLFAPILTPLAILLALGAAKLKLPIAAQSIIWVAPLLVLPFLI
jgi:hypothetical protein